MAKKKLLLIIDMQNDFIDGALANPAAQAIVTPCAAYAKHFIEYPEPEVDKFVWATLDTHGSNYLETPEGKKLPVEHCIKYTNGWLINSEIYSSISKFNPKFIEKNTFGYPNWINEAVETEVEAFTLQDFDEIHVIGTCTDICVISNVLAIKALNPNIFVHADLCAGLTSESHQKAIDIMEACQVNIVYRKTEN